MKRRLRLTRTFNRPGYADLLIDNLQFTISHADLFALADDLATLLETLAKEAKAKEQAH